MVFDDSLAMARQVFADQFEMLGSRLVYRRNGRGPAIPATEAEKDAAIDAYIRAAKWMSWATLAGMIAVLVLSMTVAYLISGRWFYLVSGCGLPVVLAVCFAGLKRAMVSSTSAFNGRTPIARELDRNEARRAMFSRLGWGQLGLGVGVTCLVVGRQALRYDLLHGWSRLWLAGGGTFLVLFALLAQQKWRSES